MTSVTAWNSIEGLPKQFVKSLRVLFDILDEQRCGYVRLQDIESRWHEEGVKGLPSGVIEALRKVTPENGYLSFDRFVSGLKLAMLTSRNYKPKDDFHGRENHLKNKYEPNTQRVPHHQHEKENRTENGMIVRHTGRTHSEVPLPPKRSGNSTLHHNRYTTNTAAVKPNNVLNALHDRSNIRKEITEHSEKKYNSREDLDPSTYTNKTHNEVPVSPVSKSSVDSYSSIKDHNIVIPPQVPPRDKSKRIINELKNWQRRINEPGQSAPSLPCKEQFHPSSSDSRILDRNPPPGVYANIDHVGRSHNAETESKPKSAPVTQKSGATVRRQNSARRHTLSSGVDYGMIKRLRQLEKEKEILLQGLEMVEQAREWYNKQVVAIEEKQKYIGKASYNEHNLEASQERMNFQQARVSEVNQQLKTLIDSSEKGFPLHMNLAMRSSDMTTNPGETIRMLKGQNRQLTQEIGQKGEIISKLEKEKATLVRDLFEARSKNKPTNYDDTTFM